MRVAEGGFVVARGHMRWIAILGLLFFAALLSDVMADTRAEEEALDVIRTLQQNVQNACVHLVSREHSISEEGKLGSETGVRNEIEGLLAGNGVARFKVEIRSNSRVDGTGDLQSDAQAVAFDGEVSTRLRYARADGDETPFEPVSGVIRAEVDTSLHTTLYECPKFALVPALYRGIGLADYLTTLPTDVPGWRVLSSDQKNSLTIWHPAADYSAAAPRSYILELDLTRGGAITRYERHIGPPEVAMSGERLAGAIESVKFKELDGIWLPESFLYVTKYFREDTGTYRYHGCNSYQCEWSGINQPEEALKFSVDFPPGIQIHDAVNDLDYTSGLPPKGREGFITEALQKLHDDEAPDTDEQVRPSVDVAEFVPESDASAGGGASTRLLLGVILMAASAALFAALAFRSRSRRKTNGE